MTTKVIIPSILMVILSFTAIAQKTSVEGYLIKESDTLKGTLFIDKSSYTPSHINFNEKEYKISEITGFGYNNINYLSHKIDDNHILLREVISGKIGLYNYYSSSGNELFVLKLYDNFHTLDNKTSTQRIDGQDYLRESNKYKGQLAYYFQDCPDVAEKINELKYRKSDLKNIITQYAKCKNENIEIPEARSTSISYGIYAGYGSSTINFTSDLQEHKIISETEFSNVFSPSAGIIFFYNLNKLSGSADLAYHMARFEGTHIEKRETFSSTITTNYNFKIDYLRLNALLKYNIFNNVFFSGGLLQNVVIKERENSRIRKVESSFGTYENSFEGVKKILKFEVGFVIGVGTTIKNHYLIELRYENAEGISSVQHLHDRRNSINILVGYKF